MQLFQLLSLRNSESVFLSIHIQSSGCILVILCLSFLLALGLYRYPSRLMSHCQGSCPIGKFSRFFQVPSDLPLNKLWHLLLVFFIPFYVSSFYCFSSSLSFFLSFLLLFLLSLVPQYSHLSFSLFLGFLWKFL